MNQRDINKLERLHSYPAKYTVDMLEYYIDKYSDEGDLILDPFVGCGTTLLASRLMKRASVGFDINPIAYQISKVKTNTYADSPDREKLNCFVESLRLFLKQIQNSEFEIINYPSIDHWFRKNVIIGLSAIRHCILSCVDERMRDLYFLAFSNIILPLSNQESDTRYSSIDKGEISVKEVFSAYIKKLLELFNTAILTSDLPDNANVYLMDSRCVGATLKKESANLLITSPPYPNTYDYYLYHKHRMLWLGYDYKPVMNTEIGSRREFSSLKKEADKFTIDLYDIFASCNEALKHGAHIVIIIGDGRVAGEKYDSRINTIKIAEQLGWTLVEEKFTYLDNTSKHFQQSFRTKGKKEYQLVFRKN